MNDKKKITLDNNTVASNPGKIEFNYMVWFKHNLLTVFALFTLMPLFIVLAIQFSMFFLIGLAISILINAFYLIRSKEHFTADSNPGVIVSVSPPLYAVYTDLTKWSGHYPVIKIEKYRSSKKVKIGDKIATVAVYENENGDDSPCWSNFFPLPVEYATNDQNSIKLELEGYSEESWEKLDLGLKRLRGIKEGLFKLETDESDW